jgi:hypothetical protein
MGPPDSWRRRGKIERYESGRLTKPGPLSPQSPWALRRSSCASVIRRPHTAWSGVGRVAAGMHRGWHEMEHSPTNATGTAWERTPWRATQRGAEAGGWLSRTRNLGVSLLLPEDEAVLVQMNRSPSIRAHQIHPVSRRDWEAATIAGLSEAGRLPQFNRAITRKGATFNPVSNALSNDVRDHVFPGSPIGLSDQ